MARLPQPGSDENTWGDLLNEFLTVSLNSNGTLKGSAVSSKADNSAVMHNTGDESVGGIKTFVVSPIVPTPTTSTAVANKAYVDATASSGTPDADASTKGKLRLTNHLGGTADAPTVPGLAAKADDTATVHKTGAETITGVKTFSNSPIVPTPASGTDVTNKTYVDAAVAGGTTPDATTSTKGKLQLAGDLGGTAALPTVPGLAAKATDTAVVHNTGAETITGVKTFSSSPIVPTPTSGTDATNKTYVDGIVTPDATNSVKGKLQLAGDLGGTAALPTVVFSNDTLHVLKAGDSMTGNLQIMGGNSLRGYSASGTKYIQVSADETWGNISTTNLSGVSFAQDVNMDAALYTRNIRVSGGAGNTLLYDIGQSSAYYKDIYARRHLFNTNAIIDGSTDGALQVTGMMGYGAAPTNTVTLSSASTGLALYNTSDQTTNYERMLMQWSSNVFSINTGAGGTGANRNLSIGAGTVNMIIAAAASSGNGLYRFNGSTGVAGAATISATGTFSAASGVQNAMLITPTINQSSTGGYTVLLINPAETATGSGAKLLIDLQVGDSSKFKVDNNGATTIVGTTTARAIQPNATNTYNLGGTGLYWSNVYATTYNLNSTASISGATAGALQVTGMVGYGSIPTHTETHASTSTGIALYNTTDQTTNYERGTLSWASNIFTLGTAIGGTGTIRALRLAGGASQFDIVDGSNSSGFYQFGRGTSAVSAYGVVTLGTWNAASTTQTMVDIRPTINQSGTAGYTTLRINPTETATGSGAKLLIDAQVGNVSKFSVSNTGAVTVAGKISNVTDPTLAQDAATKNYVDTVAIGGRTASFFLSAAGMWPSITTGSSDNTKVEQTTNKVNSYVLDFDATTQEYAEVELAMPLEWNAGTITATFYWMANSATSNGVRWGIQGRAHADGSALDQAFGAAQEVTDNNAGAANQVRITSATGALTLAGTPAGGQYVQFRVYRDPANVADDLAVDARLMGVLISYTRS